MYFVDRKKIEKMLECLEEAVRTFQANETYTNSLERYALERMAQTMIDCVLDVGNAMIDGFIMRDPGSYEDIIDILIDEKVVSEKAGEELKKVIFLRKMLVQNYIEMDHEVVYNTVKEQIAALVNYPVNVRLYLEQELGPVSAFVPQ
ncbi:DUF86 domain-containing protein [Bacillus manliponensis]|uniref:type VII toxin-antitoxin system HepT family RNase toxin n=1 Tax=Bacillus manliponensis TaxID=574376 RepID=UPI003512FD93